MPPPAADVTDAAPRAAEIRRIAAISNPVLRNLEITHCYSRLATAVAARTGEGANWCTYATWASRQAGSSIRGEDFIAHLDRKLGESRWVVHPLATLWRRLLRRGLFHRETRLGRLTAELHTPFDAFERASDAVARGNLKVFDEIGLAFAVYLEECAAGDDVAFARFLERLRPGGPPKGQRYLRNAFTRYERLRAEADERARTELAVLANLEIGLHEQTRLQPEIQEALDAPYTTKEDLGRRALDAVLPSARRWRRTLRGPTAVVARVAAARVERAAIELAREVISESLMVLSLPDRTLRLREHLADPYPDVLVNPVHAELVELIARFEPVGAAADDCGARDWSDLDQRMHYIVHLFCAFHLSDSLSRPPFTPGEVATFRRGVVPSGDV